MAVVLRRALLGPDLAAAAPSATPRSAVISGNGRFVISARGTVVVFVSGSSDLTPDADRNGTADVFAAVAKRCAEDTAGRPPSRPCPGEASRGSR